MDKTLSLSERALSDNRINALVYQGILKKLSSNKVFLIDLGINIDERLSKIYEIIDDDSEYLIVIISELGEQKLRENYYYCQMITNNADQILVLHPRKLMSDMKNIIEVHLEERIMMHSDSGAA